MYAWTQVLAGELPPAINIGSRVNATAESRETVDPFSAVAKDYKAEEAVVAPFLLRGLLWLFWLLPVILDIFVLKKRDKKLLLHLPRAFVQRLQDEVMQGLPTGEWVSSSDVVASWLVNTAYPHSRFPKGVTYQQPFDLRGRSKAVPVNSLGNPMLVTFAWMDTSQSAAIQEGARAIRLAVHQQTTPAETGKQAALFIARRNSKHNSKYSTNFMFYRVGRSQIVWGDSGASLKGHEMDWSAAKANNDDGRGTSEPLSPRWIWPIIDINGQTERNQLYMNRDGEGNFWIQLNMSEKDWSAVEGRFREQVDVLDE